MDHGDHANLELNDHNSRVGQVSKVAKSTRSIVVAIPAFLSATFITYKWPNALADLDQMLGALSLYKALDRTQRCMHSLLACPFYE